MKQRKAYIQSNTLFRTCGRTGENMRSWCVFVVKCWWRNDALEFIFETTACRWARCEMEALYKYIAIGCSTFYFNTDRVQSSHYSEARIVSMFVFCLPIFCPTFYRTLYHIELSRRTLRGETESPVPSFRPSLWTLSPFVGWDTNESK